MKLSQFPSLTDENIHPEVVAFLRNEMFSVKDVKEESLVGAEDRYLLDVAKKESQIIVTHDADFGKMVFTQALNFTGIIYLRPGHLHPSFHITTLKAVLQINLNIEPPFILVAENKGDRIKIRLRNAL